jgi:RHS repeat-associated protein
LVILPVRVLRSDENIYLVAMGCLKLSFRETGERQIFLSVWRRGTPKKNDHRNFLPLGEKNAGKENCDNYYPFGLTFNSYNRENSTPNDYKYNGKELQDELNLEVYSYGARMYDPSDGRWWSPDPFAHAYYSNSPYSYVLGNPVSNTDVQGMWTVSRHNKMTLQALSQVGIGGEQAQLIAHYSSVYADNPGGHIYLNNMLQNSKADHVHYRSDINYSGTRNSQETAWNPGDRGYNYNIWHSMRSGGEKDAFDAGAEGGISAEAATQRGREFGWGKVFDAAGSGTKLGDLEKNSEAIQNLGQGLHALQDSYAHQGRSDVGAGHIWNDFHGNTASSQAITGSAVTVYKLLTNDFDGIKTNKKGGLSLTVTGMTGEQKSKVLEKALEYLKSKNEKDKK